METEKRIFTFVKYANWLLLVIATTAGFAIFSVEMGIGVFIGGIIVTLNFHLLTKTLRKAMTPPYITSIKGVIFKYYIRFTLTGIALFFLLFYQVVNPYGLIVGLSVIVFSMMLAAINEIRQLLFKEAA